MPKSVNRPVKCVVLTVDCEILVTKEFWIPIANNIAEAKNFPSKLSKLIGDSKEATIARINISKAIGIICEKLEFDFATYSDIKLEVKAPNKKIKVKTKKVIAAAKYAKLKYR